MHNEENVLTFLQTLSQFHCFFIGVQAVEDDHVAIARVEVNMVSSTFCRLIEGTSKY